MLAKHIMKHPVRSIFFCLQYFKEAPVSFVMGLQFSKLFFFSVSQDTILKQAVDDVGAVPGPARAQVFHTDF